MPTTERGTSTPSRYVVGRGRAVIYTLICREPLQAGALDTGLGVRLLREARDCELYAVYEQSARAKARV